MRHNILKTIRVLLTSVSVMFIASYLYRNYHSIAITNYRYLFISMLIPCVVIPVIVNNRWKYFLSLNDVHENVISLAKINFMAIFYGLVLPSSQGFDLIRIYMIEKRHPQKRGKVGSSVVLERIIGMITLCIIACVAALVDPALIRGSLMIWVYALSLFVVATLCFTLAPISYRLLSSVIYYRTFKLKKLGEIIEYGRKLHESLSLTASIVVFLKSFSLILLFQVATIFNVYLVFLSMGLNVSLSVHLVLMPIVYMISMVPVTVSGIGVREGVFAYLYGRIGVAPPQAVSASLINYAILTLVPAFIGLVLAVLPSAPRLQMASVKSSKSLNESE